MNRPTSLESVYSAAIDTAASAKKALDPKLLTMVAGLALGACKSDTTITKDGNFEGETGAVDTGVDTGDTGTDDTDSGSDSGNDTGVDTGDTGAVDGTTYKSKAECENLRATVMPDVVSDDQFVITYGHPAAYDDATSTFNDKNFGFQSPDTTNTDSPVFACVFNAEGQAADVTEVASYVTDAGEDRFEVTARNLPLSGGALVLGFVSENDQWILSNRGDASLYTMYEVTGGTVSDLEY